MNQYNNLRSELRHISTLSGLHFYEETGVYCIERIRRVMMKVAMKSDNTCKFWIIYEGETKPFTEDTYNDRIIATINKSRILPLIDEITKNLIKNEIDVKTEDFKEGMRFNVSW